MDFFKNLTVEEIKQALDSEHGLSSMYHKLFPVIRNHVVRNSGTEQEAKDLFQEVLIILYQKVHLPDFELTSSIETFIFSVAKNKWLTELKKKRMHSVELELSSEEDSNNVSELIINSERINLYQKHLRSLSDGCKNVLELFFQGLKMSEIANTLNFASEGYARKRKHECQEKLIGLIRADALFEELKT